MNDFLQNFSNLLIALQVVFTAAVAFGAWSMRKAFVTRKEFDHYAGDVGRRLTAHSERLTIGDGRFDRIDDRIAGMPTAQEATELKIAIERLSGDVRVVGERIEGMEALHETLKRQVDVMDEFLRKQK